MLRVLLVEDSQLLAERLREILGQLPGVEVIATVETEKAAVAAARSTQVDTMILDLQLKEGSGFGVLRALGSTRPTVVVLTNHPLPTYEQRAKELGAEQFLDKARDFERLPAVIAAIKVRLKR